MGLQITSILYSPAHCSRVIQECFCEARGGDWLQQPVNLWSSLILVVLGLGVLIKDRRPLSRVFGLWACLAGFGTFYYHGHLTVLGEVFDYLGIYGLLWCIALRGREGTSVSFRDLTLLAAGLLGSAVLVTALPDLRRMLAALLILSVAHALYTQWKWVHRVRCAVGVLVGSLGLFLWWFDRLPLICRPDSWLQPHAIWHILGAASLGLLFYSFDSVGRKNAHK